MSAQLFTVTLTDLGTYTIDVAADTPDQAEAVARSVLQTEVLKPSDLHIVSRETSAIAAPAGQQPPQNYRVCSTYRVDFSMVVPAQSARQAEKHAERLYEDCGSPFEFDICDPEVTSFEAQEVPS